MPESFERGAMTEATCLILLSLYEPRHGYGVMQYIAEQTHGRVALGAGTLYGAINLLLEKNWIALVGDNKRKKEYRITPSGKRALEIEMGRLAELQRLGQYVMERGN